MRNLIILLILTVPLYAVEITVNTSQGRKAISPYIYGKNNSLSDNPSNPLSGADWELYRQAGLRMLRETGGNNSTKYNWRRKLSSHPDWYNNVYRHDWDYAAQSLQENLPGSRGMWAFQLIGYTASNAQNNFNDWDYNSSQWWEGVTNNWAGGGGPDAGDGDPDLYLMAWPPDSTVGILDKWFGENGLNLNENMFQYWNMDNESEIWSGTHDDIMPVQISAEEYMQRYFEVAKKARANFPDIKLIGPVPANEWQWYNWNNSKISYKGSSYCWLEFFILRIGEEQRASGLRLLDVLDVHFYPYETSAENIVQLHRIWFDKTYNYPGANGVKVTGSGGWDNSITKEYLFGRCSDWLDKYIGPDHGVNFGLTETGLNTNNHNAIAVWYASNLGVFADHGVEIFTPWYWENEMWEVLHLFSRYAHETRVASVSDFDEYVSSYASINTAIDSLTIILINRSTSESQDVHVNLSNFTASNGLYESLMLNDLSGNKTFISHMQNALTHGNVSVTDNAFEITLPALSVTAILLNGQGNPSTLDKPLRDFKFSLINYPNPFNPSTRIEYVIPENMNVQLAVYDANGRMVDLLVNEYKKRGRYFTDWQGGQNSSGIYFVQLVTDIKTESRKILFLK